MTDPAITLDARSPHGQTLLLCAVRGLLGEALRHPYSDAAALALAAEPGGLTDARDH